MFKIRYKVSCSVLYFFNPCSVFFIQWMPYWPIVFEYRSNCWLRSSASCVILMLGRVPILLLTKIFLLLLLMIPLLGPLRGRNVISSLILWHYSRELFHGLMRITWSWMLISHIFLFSRIGLAFPQLTRLQVSQGSLCRPENRVVRFLGILLDENLSFRNHVAMIRVKVSRSLGIIRNLRHTLPGSILKLFFSVLSSHMFLIALLYGCLLFRLRCGHFLLCIIRHGVWLWTPTVLHQHRS